MAQLEESADRKKCPVLKHRESHEIIHGGWQQTKATLSAASTLRDYNLGLETIYADHPIVKDMLVYEAER